MKHIFWWMMIHLQQHLLAQVPLPHPTCPLGQEDHPAILNKLLLLLLDWISMAWKSLAKSTVTSPKRCAFIFLCFMQTTISWRSCFSNFFFINFVAITNQRILHEDYSTQTVWISSSAHNKGMLFWLCFLSSVTHKLYFDSDHFCS